jgi:predicted  nucleic acid-binding Zn-ribbon protein
MATPVEILKEIHRLRRYSTDLQKRSEQIPKRRGMLEDIVAHSEKKLADTQSTIKHLKVRAHQDEVSLKGVSEQIAKYQTQTNQILSKKEFEALQHEITHGKAKASELEDQILQSLTEIDDQNALLPGLEQALKQTRQELAEFDKDSQVRLAEVNVELTKVKQQLTDTENSLPEGDLRVQYQRLIRRRGDDAFAPVKVRNCQGCYVEVTGQMANELAQGHFVVCKNCGRILYPAD